jgi:hypothetical protein
VTTWTAKVGLRKSRLHFDTLRLRKIVRQVPNADPEWFRAMQRSFAAYRCCGDRDCSSCGQDRGDDE